jgi:hypothetical protein
MVSSITTLSNRLDIIACIPVVSTLTSLVHVIAKSIFINISTESYRAYLEKKSFSDLALDAIPFFRLIEKTLNPCKASVWSEKANELFLKMSIGQVPKCLNEDNEEVKALCENPKFRLEVIKRCGLRRGLEYFFPEDEDSCDDVDFMREIILLGNKGQIDVKPRTLIEFASANVKNDPVFRRECVSKNGACIWDLDLKFDESDEIIDLVANAINQLPSLMDRNEVTAKDNALRIAYRESLKLAKKLYDLQKVPGSSTEENYRKTYNTSQHFFSLGVFWDLKGVLKLDRPPCRPSF